MQNNKMRPSKSQKEQKDKVRFYQRLFERVLPRAARGLRLISLLLFMVSGQHIHTKIARAFLYFQPFASFATSPFILHGENV